MNFSDMKTSDVHKVVIVGAGFAGLGSAITMARLGKDVTVVERQDRLAYGASIEMVNRGPDALKDLGVLEEVMDRGHPTWGKSLYDDFFDPAGNRLPLPPAPRRQDDELPCYIAIYRPYLAEILSNKAKEHGARILMGKEVVSVTDSEDFVTVNLADGSELVADLVIAGDGWRSPIREQIFPNRVTSTYSGNMSMRWVMHNPPEGDDGFYVTKNSEVVVVHSLGKGMTYLATGLDMENRHVSDEEAVELFKKAMSPFTAPYLLALKEGLIPGQEIVVRPYVYHNMPAPWHSGRVLVVGDAAHTMSAHIASGGVMALEDAVVLGQEMAKDTALDDALFAFAHRRSLRTWVAVEACRQMLDLQVNYKAPPSELGRVRAATMVELLKEY